MTLVPRIVELLREQGIDDVCVTVGGTIPADDIPELKELGVAEVFTPGAPDAGHHRLHPGRRRGADVAVAATRAAVTTGPRAGAPGWRSTDPSVNESGSIRTLVRQRRPTVKIAVLVKEVPDAAVQKRIDPATGRMDRSGEKNLNPYDTHAIEAAMQLKEGGAVQVDEIVAVTMGPDSAVSARCTRPCRWAPTARCTCPTRRWPAPTSPPPATRSRRPCKPREPRPRPARPAERRRRVLHDRRRRGRPPADALADAGHQDGRRRRGRCAASARPSTATTPSRSSSPPSSPSATRSTSRATRRSRRSWAPRRSRSTSSPPATSTSTPSKVGADGSQVECGDFKAPPAKAGGTIIEDEDTDDTVEKIVAWLDERKLI